MYRIVWHKILRKGQVYNLDGGDVVVVSSSNFYWNFMLAIYHIPQQPLEIYTLSFNHLTK